MNQHASIDFASRDRNPPRKADRSPSGADLPHQAPCRRSRPLSNLRKRAGARQGAKHRPIALRGSLAAREPRLGPVRPPSSPEASTAPISSSVKPVRPRSKLSACSSPNSTFKSASSHDAQLADLLASKRNALIWVSDSSSARATGNVAMPSWRAALSRRWPSTTSTTVAHEGARAVCNGRWRRSLDVFAARVTRRRRKA
jgi:hypothetical protein